MDKPKTVDAKVEEVLAALEVELATASLMVTVRVIADQCAMWGERA